MPTYWKKYTSRNKENGQMIKKTYAWKQKEVLWFIRGKECIFGSALPNGLHWTLSAQQKQSKYKGTSGICGSQNKVQFLATIVSNVSTIIYRRKCNGTFKTGRAFLITLSPEKHK